MSRCFLGVHSLSLGRALCLLLRRARLDLRAEVEQKEIGELSLSHRTEIEERHSSC